MFILLFVTSIATSNIFLIFYINNRKYELAQQLLRKINIKKIDIKAIDDIIETFLCLFKLVIFLKIIHYFLVYNHFNTASGGWQ